jgi:prepilin-type N-terminal cleavage/methylation domain-containing protein
MAMKCRRAFTMIEVVVALVIILVLAAVALPNVTGYLDQQRVDAAATQLAAIRDALYGPGTSFEGAINANAGRLSELTQPILSGNASYATGTDDSCGAAFSNGERDDWEDNGPFTTYHSDRATGMMTPIGLAADSLTRIPNSATTGNLRITFINSVELNDAELLDQKIDGTTTGGSAAGTVQWTPAAGVNGVVTMYYFVPINNRC